jgi:hypothetical protein
LAHLALHYKESSEKLKVENIEDYLYFCQKQHKTPSESFFKHTIFGLRAATQAAKRVSYTPFYFLMHADHPKTGDNY